MREKRRNVCSPRLRREIPPVPALLLPIAGRGAANKIAAAFRDPTCRNAGATSSARGPTVILRNSRLRPLHCGRAAFRIFLGFEVLHLDLRLRFRWFFLSCHIRVPFCFFVCWLSVCPLPKIRRLSSGAYFAASPASAEAALRIFPGFEVLHFDLSSRFRWFLLR